MRLAPVLTPHGALVLRAVDDAPELAAKRGQRLMTAFARGGGHGLLRLGADEVGAPLPPFLAWWRELATQYLLQLCALPELGEGATKQPLSAPADGELTTLVLSAPPMQGAEYLTVSVL